MKDKEENMKRFSIILSLLLAIILMFSLAACNGGEDDLNIGDAVKITFWNPITGPDSSYMQTLVSDFNKQYKGQIYVDVNTQAEDKHYQRILTSFTDNSTADVCIVHLSRIASFHRAGKLRDLTGMAEEIGLKAEDYVSSLWSSCEIEGKMYALPYDVLPIVLYYNRKLIPQGFSESDILSEDFTLDDMLEMMRTAYQDAPISNKKVYGMSFNYAFTEMMFLSFLNQQGVYAVDPSNPTVPTFNNEAGYAAAEAVRSIPFTVNQSGKKVSSESGADHLNIFLQGRALFTIDGIWSAPDACNKTEKVDAGIALLPKLNNQVARKVAAEGHCLVAFENSGKSEEKDRAISTFINYLISRSGYWCQGGKVAARQDVANDDVYKVLEWAYLSEKLDRLVLPVNTYTFDTITNPIGIYVARLCEGIETDVRKAIDQAAKDAKEKAEKL